MVALLVMAAGSAWAQDAHGAIAFGQTDNAGAYAFAWDYPTKDEAETAALNDCLSATGGAACNVLAWFQNGCGALALGQHGTAQGRPARTRELAEARALASCKAAGGVGCAVVGSECVSTSGEPATWLGRESVTAISESGASDTPAGQTEDSQQIAAAPKGPKCADMGSNLDEKHAACWQEIQSQPGCYVWNKHYHSDRTADWTGECSNGTAHGKGSFSLSEGSDHYACTASAAVFEYGEQHGHWVSRYANGTVTEGPYVAGEQHGYWVIRYATGTVTEGPYAAGKRHGHWVTRWGGSLAGKVDEGPYVDGKRHGHWVFIWDGGVSEGLYVDGKRHGHWVESTGGEDETVSEGPYVDGKKHGHWVRRWHYGEVDEGPYVDGEKHGRWVTRDENGNIRHEGPFVDGKMHGRWVRRFADGSVLSETEWRNGVAQ